VNADGSKIEKGQELRFEFLKKILNSALNNSIFDSGLIVCRQTMYRNAGIVSKKLGDNNYFLITDLSTLNNLLYLLFFLELTIIIITIARKVPNQAIDISFCVSKGS
jgi:hypothetical protein